MVYMGSKSKYTEYIVPILQKEIDERGARTHILSALLVEPTSSTKLNAKNEVIGEHD